MRHLSVGRAFWPRVAFASLALTLVIAACGDEEGDGSGSFASVSEADIFVNPPVLTFDGTEIGASVTQFVSIANIGEGDLVVSDISLNTRSSEFALVGVELPFTLGQNQERIVEVTYTPVDCENDGGALAITSNDRDDAVVELPLQPQPLTGQVSVFPNPVDFGRVPSGTSKTIEVEVANSGTCSLVINDLFLTGSFDFRFTEGTGDDIVDVEPELPFTLEPAASELFQMTYSPSNDGFDEATLIVRSDDAANRTVDVPVLANGDQACIVVSDEEGIDFGQRFIGETHPKTVTITNCSQREDLLVSGIELFEHFEILGHERYTLADTPELPATIIPQESESFILNYNPIGYTPENRDDCDNPEGCELPDAAILEILSNDEVKSPLEIEVRGIGTDNHCPTAVARARVQGSSTPWDVAIDTIPLNTLEFDGRNSTDSEGEIASYQWEITDRPVGSVATLVPNATVPNPTFFLDLAGEFRFSLRVFDESGVESCDTAEVLVVVTPDEAIHVQLVWTTDGDPNQLDTGAGTGSDVDLHFVHPNAGGTWDAAPWDCHWKNKVPNWGESGSAEDDPSLDIDDTDGWGPENINLDQPEGTAAAPVCYSVGAFYFSDHDYGPSDVTTRIFLDGVERFALTFPGLEDRQFWDVARVCWPTRDIERIHRLYPSGFP